MNWHDLRDSVAQGIERARKTISDMTGKEVKVLYEMGGVFTLPSLPALMGAPEKVVTISYVTFRGDEEGQLMIIFSPGARDTLALFLEPDIFQETFSIKALGDSQGVKTARSPQHTGNSQETRSEMLDSFAAEIANIVGSQVLNAMADRAGLTIRPSPPVLIRDMAGAILQSALAMCLVTSNSAYVSDVKLGFGEGEQLFEIVLMPKTLEGMEPGDGSAGCFSWMANFWS